MLVHDVIQGTPEWLAVRLGLPTASAFDKLITPTGKASTQGESYENKLIAEILTGKPVDEFEGNIWTERGKLLEPDAVSFYEFQRDVTCAAVGFITDDLRTVGCSPDRLVGEDGLLEIKCPAPHTHVKYLLEGEIDKGYYPQVQGQLLVTGRKWVDWLSYHPEMAPVIIRVERDEVFLKALQDILSSTTKSINTKLAKLNHQRKAA